MNTWMPLAGWTLAHFVWQGSVIWIVTFVMLRTLRRASAEVRYVTACAALAAMFAAPVATAVILHGAATASGSAAGAGRGIGSTGAIERVIPQSIAPIEDRGATVSSTLPEMLAFDFIIGPWPQALALFWLAGVSILFARFVGGWWRTQRLHRAVLVSTPSPWSAAAGRIALQLGIRRAVHVVDWLAIDTPTVIGWTRPVIVLPVAALAGLTPAQVEAILAHELAHVRRHDFVVNVLQTLTEILLFYHPAIWWLSARIRHEREHCCDAVAVKVCGDPIAYAEALTELAARTLASESLALAATGGPLLDRIRYLLGQPADDAPRPAGAVVLTTGAVVLALVAGTTHFVRASQVGDPASASRAAAQPADAETWDVVYSHSTGELRFIGFTGRDLIRFAYQIPRERVVGGPSWIDDETFTLSTHLAAPPAADETPAIVHRLLEEQFQLRTHRETRAMPAYALVMARSDRTFGPGLRPSTATCLDRDDPIAAGRPARIDRLNTPRLPVCGDALGGSLVRKSWVGVTMTQFARELSGMAELAAVQRRHGAPALDVIDRTSLTGRFDVEIRALRPAVQVMSRYPLVELLLGPIGVPSAATAIDKQLGLALESTTAPYDVITIDSAQRPEP